LPRPVTDQLRKDFKAYVDSLKTFCVFERNAEIKIYEIIYAQNGMMLENYIEYFKSLVKHMKNSILVNTDESLGHPPGGKFTAIPLRVKESAGYYTKVVSLSLYYWHDGNNYTVYDFGYRT
jgi:hypothetical protein